MNDYILVHYIFLIKREKLYGIKYKETIIYKYIIAKKEEPTAKQDKHSAS